MSSTVPGTEQCSADAMSSPSLCCLPKDSAHEPVYQLSLYLFRSLLNAIILNFLSLLKTGKDFAWECCHSLVIQLWLRILTSLRLRVVVYKSEIIVILTLENSSKH